MNFDPRTVLIKSKGIPLFTIADAFAGVCGFGATGSGKSTGPGEHFARAYLKNQFGGLVLCAKPEERILWQKLAKQESRERDLVIFDPTGDASFNFLDYLAEHGAGNSIDIVNGMDEIANVIDLGGGGGQNSNGSGDGLYFKQSLSHLSMNAVDLCLLAGLRVELPVLRAIVTSAPLSLAQRDDPQWQENSICWKALREAEAATKDNSALRPNYEECRNYWELDFPALSDKPRSITNQMFSMMVRPFITHPLRRLFAEDTTVTPEDTFAGRIIVIDLPVQRYRLAGRAAALAWKYCFQFAVMRRSAGNEADLRPVFLWADEAQNFATERDAEYQAVARSARGCTVYITQQRESLRSALRNNDAVENLLANLQTKIFCQNTGPTNHWASELLGERFLKITSVNINHDIRQAHDGSPGDVNNSSGIQRSEDRRYYVEPARFTTLKRGGLVNDRQVEAIVYCGGKLFDDPKSGEPLPYKLLTFRQN
jgi:hypothetical protein